MPLYDYRVAKSALSEGEKDRILAIYLNTTADASSTIDWETASAHYGSKSVDSMRVSVRNIYRKLEKAGAKRESMDDKSPSASLKIKLAASGSKRNTRSDEGEEQECRAAPKAKRSRPSRKTKKVAVAEAVGDAEKKVEMEEEEEEEE